MSIKKGSNVVAVILGSSMLAAGTTVALAAANTGSPETKASDAQISQQVKQKLTRDMPGSLVGLQVQTQDGVVTLSGRADTGLSELKALQDARRVPGVTDVKNHLKVTM